VGRISKEWEEIFVCGVLSMKNKKNKTLQGGAQTCNLEAQRTK